MKTYDFNKIDHKWQKYWAKNQTFKAENNSSKPKYYVLDMFPYPSGAGLHVGHPLGYIASDIYARYKRHKGYNVLHPMGYDSFGLPAEQYAIQTGQHPAITTETNIKRYREQMDKIGFSFDWDREIRTSDPKYYKWTQWIFLQLFNSYYSNDVNQAKPVSELIEIFEKEGNLHINAVCDSDTPKFTAAQWNAFSDTEKDKVLHKYRLTYLADAEVNWCPALGTVLANDEVINGVSERGGHPVIRKKMRQWMMRITAYAERLLQDLDTLDWTEPLKEMQRNWIGKSTGASIWFEIDNSDKKFEVFTTRADTLFGVTFMVMAPEHELVNEITTDEYREKVKLYQEKAARKSERERLADAKEKTGQFTGAYALHPFTGEKIPIWISDYVLAGYGTGAIMAVPSGDQRDYEFAKQFNIPIVNIFEGNDISEKANEDKDAVLINSGFLNGLTAKEAIPVMISELEKRGIGKAEINYRLRDAVFSRQRYWGEPFPIYYKKGVATAIPEKHLPVELPEVEKYLPTEDGQPPLGNAKEWAWDEVNEKIVSNDLIDDESVFPMELNTMPGWAGSSWYFNRYMDPHNEEEPFGKDAVDYWQKVDLYLGGSEHATGHLLYSRFWQKFLFDIGRVPEPEYSVKLINQGMILGNSAFAYRINGTNKFVSYGLKEQYDTTPIHVDVNMVDDYDYLDIEKFKSWRSDFNDAEFILEDGKYKVGREVEKMSKSKYNVVNPDDIVEQYGADTLRMYEMFLGPIEIAKPWNTAGLKGVFNFLRKFWTLFHNDGIFDVSLEEPTEQELKILHKTIKKVTDDIENFSFNTAVSQFMIAVNELQKLKTNKRKILSPMVILLSPFAPHLAEELWDELGHDGESIAFEPYPVYEERYLKENTKTYPVMVNGKMKHKLNLPANMNKEEIEKVVLADEKVKQLLEGKQLKKVIVVPGKIVNLVV
jgi:leucyl-tRNA synthetase